jgi:diguanylate cyclase (GGDEF)-like protein
MNQSAVNAPIVDGDLEDESEQRRLAEMASYAITRDRSDPDLDVITKLAIEAVGAAIGGISLVYQSQIWLPSRCGLEERVVPRAGSFCTRAIGSNSALFEVEDASVDVRFCLNPLVADAPHYRHYAGVPLRGSRGYLLGTLWVMTAAPRRLTPAQATLLQSMARVVVDTLELRYFSDATGMPNRAVFLHHLQLGCERAERAHVMVGFVDLLRFRQINAVYGRAVGTDVLRLMGHRLSAWAGSGNLVGHLGGDKFAFALFGEPAAIGERLALIKDAIGAPFTLAQDAGVVVHARVGVLHRPTPYIGAAAALLDAADMAATSISAGQVCTTIREYGAPLLACGQLGEQLKALLAGDAAHGALVVHYQPQVDVARGALVGMEALVRWQHPQRGLLLPPQFISLADSCDVIYALDLAVLDQVCRDLRDWRAAGLPVVPVALNLSRRTLLAPGLLPALARALAAYAIPARLLEVEVNECELLASPELVAQRLDAVRALGLRVAVDDFGIGYSNLDAITQFPFDRLKVDRQFVHGVAGDARVAALFKLIQGIAVLFKAELMCEGVETADDLAWLDERGASCVQGWYFSAARAAPSVAALLAAVRASADGAAPLDVAQLRALMTM